MSQSATAIMPKPKPADGDSVYLRAITEDILGWADPASRLQKALVENDFLLFAQPIQPLQLAPVGPGIHEILLRLREEEDNMLPPGGFFPVAEALGMLEDIDRWVVNRTVAWCARNAGSAVAPMCCINLSTEAISNPAFAAYVRRQIDTAGLPGKRLCLEITEADALAQPLVVRQFIAALKPLGCRFSLDNFGSVKVSFTHIKDLPIDYLKVDGSIIQNVLKSPGDLARARAISLTCQRLGMRAIAQNVESPEVLDKLREIGFAYVQGFGISQPCPIDALYPG